MLCLLLVLRLAAVLLLKTTCVFGNTCNCDLVSDVLTKEIFDLKIENRQLTSRMDQIESLLRTQRSEMSPPTELDTDRSHLLETRITAIESKIQETSSYLRNSLRLHNPILKGLREEKTERLRNELKIATGLQKINESLTEFNIQSDAIIESLQIKISDHVRDIKSEMFESIVSVKNDVMGISYKVEDLEKKTNDLRKNGTFVEEIIGVIKGDFSRVDSDVKAIIDMVILDQKAICQPNCANGGVCFKHNICKCKPLTDGNRCEKAICQPNCANGGVCLKDNICKCKPLTDGNRCEIAICQPNCANGGVCLKDNICKCKPLTDGNRCEIVICDDKCSENGGECVAAGVCICPEGRFGPNCNQRGCKLPTHAAMVRNPRLVYSPGERLADFFCDDGFSLSSQDGMTCFHDDSWSDIVTCEKGIVYLISVKTDDIFNSGTDGKVSISLHGYRGNTNKIDLQGTFETGNLDETVATAKDIRPITRVEIGLDGDGLTSDWKLDYVTVYVEAMEEYYHFRLEKPVLVTAKEKTVLPVQGKDNNCVDSFDSGQNLSPKWNVLGRKKIHVLIIGRPSSARKCKQACIIHDHFPCAGVLYNKGRALPCIGISVTDKSYFYQKNKPGYLGYLRTGYLRACKQIE